MSRPFDNQADSCEGAKTQPLEAGAGHDLSKLDTYAACPTNFNNLSPSSILLDNAHTELPRMNKFLTGFKKFQKTYFRENRELFSKLAHHQAPKTLLIGCCDSRVDPAILTSCEPGDLFVVRNVANLVPPYEPGGVGLHGVSAAIEFAVNFLQVDDIIVLGHVNCGGIAALMEDSKVGEFMTPWMSIARRARENVLRKFADCPTDAQRRACEHASILVSLENLVSYPWIQERLKQKRITINGWYFNFESGELHAYSPATGGFEVLIQAVHDSPMSGSGSTPCLSSALAKVNHQSATQCQLSQVFNVGDVPVDNLMNDAKSDDKRAGVPAL